MVGKGENGSEPAFSPFARNVFYPFQKGFLFLSYIYFIICKGLQFGSV